MPDRGNRTSPSSPSSGGSKSNEPSSSSPPSSRTSKQGNKNNAPPPPTKTTSRSSKNGSSQAPPPPQKPPRHPPPQSKGAHTKALSRSQKTSSSYSNFFSKEKAIIIGGAAGTGLLLILMIVCLICCCNKRRKRRRHEKMQQYYRDQSHGNTSNDYFNSGGWNTKPPQNSHELRMPPSAQVSSEYNWPIQPPPPPLMTSSDLGSMNFSNSGLHTPQPLHMSMGFNQSSFTYEELASATGGFASNNLLGQGGFGYVHKGVLPNGKEVAVKSLKANSGQGEREFQAEVDIISRVHHRHLVSLVGYCIAGAQRMLVYEFVENDTLENRLHGKGMPPMAWSIRLEIALGSAKGFAYLHEDCHPRIIHRDIKASNILLDENFEAKVADFGLAKLSSDTNTHVSTRIMGTFGYLAPEYASSGKLTEKSDIYSYGVVLLELITGKRPVDMHSDDEDSLVDWARPILSRILEGGHSYEEIADPLMEGNYHPQEMLRMIGCAAACIRHSARRRPKMSQIVRALEGDASLDDLNQVKKSPSSSTFVSSNASAEHELKKVQKPGLSSQDFSSGDHGTTGEFTR